MGGWGGGGGVLRGGGLLNILYLSPFPFSSRGLPFSTCAPRGTGGEGGGGQASYTFPLRITCKKKKGGGSR